MTVFVRRVLVFLLQFFGTTGAVVAGGVIFSLRRYGLDYRHTMAFRADLLLFVKAGLAAAALFCLVLLCYHLTRKTLQGPDDTSYNNTDNI